MRIQDATLFHVGPDARKVCSLKGIIFLRNLEWPCTFILISDSQVKRNESAYDWHHDYIVVSIEFPTFVLIVQVNVVTD